MRTAPVKDVYGPHAAAPTRRLTARHSYARYEFASLPMFSASANHSRSSMA
ncbi:hypothetical protein [Neisseria gonorrhoeae]|uniref:hypothetical protein n=1 Tax=Neisseria gonorrhoeae TaxID=485 RepID=UPI0027D95A8B|nr:hypothetical protein [Neisseria gonorrhoeae]